LRKFRDENRRTPPRNLWDNDALWWSAIGIMTVKGLQLTPAVLCNDNKWNDNYINISTTTCFFFFVTNSIWNNVAKSWRFGSQDQALAQGLDLNTKKKKNENEARLCLESSGHLQKVALCKHGSWKSSYWRIIGRLRLTATMSLCKGGLNFLVSIDTTRLNSKNKLTLPIHSCRLAGSPWVQKSHNEAESARY
jgi:hypothetical protein